MGGRGADGGARHRSIADQHIRDGKVRVQSNIKQVHSSSSLNTITTTIFKTNSFK